MTALRLGGARCLEVRTERVAVGARARLLYASDLHLGRAWTRRVPQLLADAVSATAPDAVLLGGDLVDGPRGVSSLEEAVRTLAAHAPVAAVPGNHDVSAGRGAVRAAVVAGGGTWLPDAPLAVGGLRVDGRLDSVASGAPVLCAHDPATWPRARAAGYALTLAGHLHGCQVRLAARGGREYPGAWLYRWNGPRFSAGRATLLVSRGAADTLPVRWNCPHEVLLVECL